MVTLQQRADSIKKSMETWQTRLDEAETIIRKGETMKHEATRQLDMHISNLQLLEVLIQEQNATTTSNSANTIDNLPASE